MYQRHLYLGVHVTTVQREIRSDYNQTTKHAVDYNSCYKRCRNRTDCIAFTYNADKETCVQHFSHLHLGKTLRSPNTRSHVVQFKENLISMNKPAMSADKKPFHGVNDGLYMGNCLEKGSEWRVDLGSVYFVRVVRVFVALRAKTNSEISFSLPGNSEDWRPSGCVMLENDMFTFHCKDHSMEATRAQHVRVTITQQYKSLCEVEVYGLLEMPLDNQILSVGKPVTMSTTKTAAVTDSPVNDGNFLTCSVDSDLSTSPSLTIDLQGVFPISLINITYKAESAENLIVLEVKVVKGDSEPVNFAELKLWPSNADSVELCPSEGRTALLGNIVLFAVVNEEFTGLLAFCEITIFHSKTDQSTTTPSLSESTTNMNSTNNLGLYLGLGLGLSLPLLLIAAGLGVWFYIRKRRQREQGNSDESTNSWHRNDHSITSISESTNASGSSESVLNSSIDAN